LARLRLGLVRGVLGAGGHVVPLPAEPDGRFLAGAAAQALESLGRAALLLGVSALLLALPSSSRERGRAAVLFLLLVFADLAQLARPFVVPARPEEFFWDPGSVAVLRRAVGSERLVTLTNQRALNQGIGLGIANVGGYDSTNLGRYARVMARLLGRDERTVPTVVQPPGMVPGVRRMAGRCLLVAANVRVRADFLEPVAELPVGNLYRSLRSTPRAAFVSGLRVADEEAMITRFQEELREGEPVLVDAETAAALPGRPASGRVSALQSPDPNRVVIEVECSGGDGVLLLRDTYYPGWRAEADGREVALFPGEGIFRVVRVPQGTRELRLVFAPGDLRLGLFGSLVGLLLLAAVTPNLRPRV
jgi:hypothetical protein